MVLTPPQSLVRHLREGRCVLFAGSGLSAWAGLPTWNALLGALIAEMRAEQIALEDVDEMDRLVESGKLLEVAEHCKTQLGNRYVTVLSERLRTPSSELPEPHRIIVRLPFSGVVTTNYDNLLETGYQKLTSISLKAPTHEDTDVLGTLLFDESFFVLKAHGNLDRPQSLVLTSSDYRDILHSNPAFNAFFSSILMSKAVLFVGYSLNDPDFRMLLDRHLSTFQRWVPERYALMPEIGAVEAKVMWESMRIRVLSYTPENGRHNAVVDFLRELERLVAAGDQHAVATAGPTSEGGGQEARAGTVRVSPSGAEAAYARLSLRLEAGELASAFETPDGRVRAGRSAMPDPLTLSRLQGDPFGFEREMALAAAALSESVPAGLLAELAAIVEPGEPLVLSAQREVEALPWEWILVDDEHLALRNPVVRVSPALSEAARGSPIVGQPPRLLLIGDPTSPETTRLPGALEEVERIATLSEGAADAKLLTADDATVANVITSLRRGDADVFHFAGHAWFDGSEHYMALADGQLRAAEFRSVLSARPPALVFLNSHYTAFVPPFAKVREQGRGQEEVSAAEQLRFMDVAMAAGCGAFIGCLGSPMDATARDLALGLYERLFRGESVARAFHQSLVTLQTEPRSDALKYAVSGLVDLALLTALPPASGLAANDLDPA